MCAMVLEVKEVKQKSSEWCTASNFKKVFGDIVADQTTFFAQIWEKEPCKFSWNGPKKASMDHIMTREGLLRVVSDNEIVHETNLAAMRYTSEGRLPLHFDSDVITKKDIVKAFKDNYTVQFFQPQRFSDGLHVLCAGFEHVFGTLAGASTYLTPPRAQGLAPHHDDVDVFIFHTEGTKRWRLWSALSPLPETPSSDLSRDQLPGNAVEITLSPGDVLYLPRGVIHEAIAEDSFCTHVTLSVYQRHNLKTLLLHALPLVLEKAFADDVSYRRGLPLRLNQHLGSYPQWAADVGSDKRLIANRGAMLSTVQNLLSSVSQYLTIDALDAAADEIDRDFRAHRIPPPVSADAAVALDIDEDDVLLCDASCFHAAVQSEDGIMVLLLAGIRNNSRMNHMGHPSLDSCENMGSACCDVPCDENSCFDAEQCHADEQSEVSGEDVCLMSTSSDEDSGEGIEDEGWETMLPIRSARLLYVLQQAYNSGGITLKKLSQALPDFNIEEVSQKPNITRIIIVIDT